MSIRGRTLPPSCLAAIAVFALAACSSEPRRGPTPYRSALTGEECVPDPGTLMPGAPLRGGHRGRGGHRSPTGIPGDNLDDLRSGHVDCLGDGNSGHGNDPEGCFPRPGCDAEGCCETEPDPDPVGDGGCDHGDDPDDDPEPEVDAGGDLI